MREPNLKWSLSGNDADLFCIGNNDGDPNFPRGELQFKAIPDFEAPMDAGHNNTYNVTVVVTDSRGNTATRDVVVTVTNEEEAGDGNPVDGAAGGWRRSVRRIERPRRPDDQRQVAVVSVYKRGRPEYF